MSNTGKKIVLTLKEIAQPANTPTGDVKDNVPTDLNYIAPYTDLEDCPITYNMTCPEVIFTKNATSIFYEFNLSNEVVKNPAVLKVRVATSLGGHIHTYTLPNGPSENFFASSFTGLNPILDYDLTISFLGTGDTVLHSCEVDV